METEGKMEKYTLTPAHEEIIVNSGSTEGAIDLFSYDAEMEPAARNLGPLFVLGWRTEETNTMEYMVSLIAAMARREYFMQPDADPKEAFARTLRRVNEVVDEFFKSAGARLSVGIFALPGNLVMVSKLGSFKVLLARDGQVIDILNNVMLFSKEHLEKRRFSSVISGSIHPGDRLLAYYPSKPVVARERQLKSWLLAGSTVDLRSHLERLGQENPAFGASFVHIDVSTTAVPAPESAPMPAPEPAPVDTLVPEPTLAWAPRQAAAPAVAAPTPAPRTVPPVHAPSAPQEIPHLIPTEYSMGTRRWSFGRAFSGIRFIRMDTRGKAVVLGISALVIAGAAFMVRSVWMTSPEETRARQLITEASDDLSQATTKSGSGATMEARALLVRALGTLTGDALRDNGDARRLVASVTAAMDKLDNAQPATVSVLAQPDVKTDRVLLATWSSTSQSLWAVTQSADKSMSVASFKDGSVANRIALPESTPDILIGWRDGVLVVGRDARSITRVTGGVAKSFPITTQETVLDAAQFSDSVYVLTDKSILKVSGFDTDRVTTKVWLAKAEDFVSGARHIFVDGNIYTMSDDGTLVTYYKGKKAGQTATPVASSGAWELIPGPDGQLAVTDTGLMRVYEFSARDGSLSRTLRVDSDQPLVLMAEGSNGTAIAVTKDNRIWQVR